MTPAQRLQTHERLAVSNRFLLLSGTHALLTAWRSMRSMHGCNSHESGCNGHNSALIRVSPCPLPFGPCDNPTVFESPLPTTRPSWPLRLTPPRRRMLSSRPHRQPPGPPSPATHAQRPTPKRLCGCSDLFLRERLCVQHCAHSLIYWWHMLHDNTRALGGAPFFR